MRALIPSSPFTTSKMLSTIATNVPRGALCTILVRRNSSLPRMCDKSAVMNNSVLPARGHKSIDLASYRPYLQEDSPIGLEMSPEIVKETHAFWRN